VIYCYFLCLPRWFFPSSASSGFFTVSCLWNHQEIFFCRFEDSKCSFLLFFHVFTNFWLSLIPICRQITALLYTCMWSFPAESINVIWKFPSIDLRLHKKVLAQFLRGSWYIPLNDLWFVGSDIYD
jgi:hypothetical protein